MGETPFVIGSKKLFKETFLETFDKKMEWNTDHTKEHQFLQYIKGY